MNCAVNIEKIYDTIVDVMRNSDGQIRNRWEHVASLVNMSLNDLRAILISNDKLGIIAEVKKFVNSLEDLKEQNVYLGTTSNATNRKTQHMRTHGPINFRTMKTFYSLENGLLAEAIGIIYLEMNRTLFKRYLNESKGFEETTKNTGNNQTIYIFATKTPYQGEIDRREAAAGVICHNTRAQGKVAGKKYCVTCQKPITSNRFWEHVFVHLGPQFPCNECFERFRSQEILDKHKIKTHTFVFKCPRCPFRGAIAEFRDSHMMQCAPELFEPKNKLAKRILEGAEV